MPKPRPPLKPSRRRKTPGTQRVDPEAAVLRRLRRALPRGVGEVLERLGRAGGRPVLVGGAVRNALLGRPVSDWDVATALRPEVVAELFSRVVRAGEKHGTIMVLTDTGPVEVTTFRSEGPYLDGRRPSHVAFHDDVEIDLSRRDFTINAMAVDWAAGVFVDPFGGRADLRARRIRCVGEAAQRFAEDGLRPLRAVRFAAVLDFRVEAKTAAAIGATLDTFDRVAWERKRDEMGKLLGSPRPLAGPLALLHESGLLERLAPELSAGARSAARPAKVAKILEGLPPDPWLRLAGWLFCAGVDEAAARAIGGRWRLSRNDVDHLGAVLRGLSTLPAVGTGADLRRWVASLGFAAAQGAARIGERTRAAPKGLGAKIKRLQAQALPLTPKDLAIGGHDLQALGFSGPAVGEVLRQLLDEVHAEPSLNKTARLLERAHKLSTTQAERAQIDSPENP